MIKIDLALDVHESVTSGRWHTAIRASTSVTSVSGDVDILGSVG